MQGLSLDKGVVSFDRQKLFNPDQMCTVLDRITSINRMYLVGNYSKKAIKENSSAKKKFQRLRCESKITALSLKSVSEITFILHYQMQDLQENITNILRKIHIC